MRPFSESPDLVLQESPKGVFWSVGELVIKVYEGSLDLRQGLEFLLQGLPDVVSLSQQHLRRQHDVHLHKVVRAKRVGSDSVDVLYGLMVPTRELTFSSTVVDQVRIVYNDSCDSRRSTCHTTMTRASFTRITDSMMSMIQRSRNIIYYSLQTDGKKSY
ncbi:unnamed protein product [Spirodela intermedia]|uniref:Uncharacterized protein n=2 Tax=Spirodela intermedia TaxID=51605 RepID=A0A7I8IGD5_SPIIN|nr:unnamed protein product [Spirodela intermedia]CAA6656841.1 unnamed protein product [Spirodela intermedia]CAA7392787.1 unnamed protein product [Spirodela intermedia]